MRKEKMYLTEHTEITESNRLFYFFRFAEKIKQTFSFFFPVPSVSSSEASERVRDIRRSSAFTLVELLIVIVLMAIIIGISAPAFIGMGRGAGMRGSVRAVCSTLSLLRQWAITHREEVTFYYSEGVAPSASYYYATASGVLIEKTNELPLEVKFGPDDGVGNPYEVTFKTDGGLAPPVGSATKHIYIRDRKFPDDTTKQKTISVNGLTGGIRVE